jgi:hypothetical protein
MRSRWLVEPLAVDAALQLAILWSRLNNDAACLPTRIGAFRRFADSFDDSVRLNAVFKSTSANACVGDFEFVGTGGNLVARLDRCEFVVDASLNEAFQRRECSAGS